MFNQLFRVADPYQDLRGLHRQMEVLFGDLARPRARARASGPAIDVLDEGESYRVVADVPGLRPQDLQIDVTEDGITVRGERAVQAPEGYSVHRREREPFRLARSFTFPTKVDPDGVDATLDQGVLTITLAKRADTRPRSITVRSAA